MKIVLVNLEYSFPIFVFLVNQARLRVGGNFQHLFWQPVSYLLHRGNVRSVSLPCV